MAAGVLGGIFLFELSLRPGALGDLSLLSLMIGLQAALLYVVNRVLSTDRPGSDK